MGISNKFEVKKTITTLASFKNYILFFNKRLLLFLCNEELGILENVILESLDSYYLIFYTVKNNAKNSKMVIYSLRIMNNEGQKNTILALEGHYG